MNHYELLQVSPQATSKDLRQAFRTLSKLYHPDTTVLTPIEAAARFQELQHAYTILINPDSRQAYDAELIVIQLRQSMKIVASSNIGLNRRPFSGGEWFAILLLCLAMGSCLILALGLAWIEGKELIAVPIWLEQSYTVNSQPKNMSL